MATTIRPEDLPPITSLSASDSLIVDNGAGVFRTTPVEIVAAGGADPGLRDQLEADTGATIVGTPDGPLQDVLNEKAPTTDAVMRNLRGRGGNDEVRNTIVGDEAHASATTGYGETAVGYRALFSSTDAFYNVAIGWEAMRDTNGNAGLGEASNNVAVGAGAMQFNTTGYSNVAIGRGALRTSTTGYYNTVVGHAAMFNSSTARDNEAFGDAALYSATTAARNSAYGKESLNRLVSGVENVAMGGGASYFNQIATGTVAVGYRAMRNNTADFVTAVGYEALFNNTSGALNIGIGKWAGYNFTTGSNNVAIGAASMHANVLGNQNVAVGSGVAPNLISSGNVLIGYGAGDSWAAGSTALTGASNNTLIGHQAAADSASASGVIAIGKDAVGPAATGVTSATHGPGIAFGSTNSKVGFRGDGTIYPTAGASAGYLRVKVNGTFFKIQLFADA